MVNLPWRKKQEETYPVMDLKKHIDDVFENFWKSPFGWSDSASLMKTTDFNPRVEVTETEKEIKVTAELPGMTEKDIEVTIDDNTLVLKGEKKQEEEKKEGEHHYTERRYGSFYRSMLLPPNILSDKIDASFKKGILVLTIPKEEQVESRKRIEIGT